MGFSLMGLLLLSIAVVCGVAKGYCGRTTGNYAKTIPDSAKVSLFRMMFCAIIGFCIAFISVGFENIVGISTPSLLTAMGAGVSMAMFIIVWLICVRKNAYMLVSVFTNVGVLVPFFLCAIFFGDTISIKQYIGVAVIIVAVIIMFGYNQSLKGVKVTVGSVFLLVFCGFLNGMNEFLNAKVFTNLKVKTDNSVAFQFWLYLSAFVVLALYLIGYNIFIKRTPEQKADAMKMSGKLFLLIVVISSLTFVFTLFKTLASEHLGSVQLYTMSLGGDLFLSNLMAAVILHEKPTVKSIVGIVLTFSAMLLINL